MKNTYVFGALLLIFTFLVASCGGEGGGDSAQDSDETFTNPFQYCEAVGTVDEPGANYTGEKVTTYIAQQLKGEFGAPESVPIEAFEKGTYWRCMDGSLYACNVGANLPCNEKADVSKEPNEGMLNYCGENPDSDFIPAYAQGRATVFEWKCSDGTPEIVKQVVDVDAAGYQKNIWYKIKPPEDIGQKDVLRQ